MSLLRLLGEQFVITILCIGPGSICAGALLILPFAGLFKILNSSALAVFAILSAFGVATRTEKENIEKMSVKTRMFVFLGAYVSGALVGVLLTGFYSQIHSPPAGR